MLHKSFPSLAILAFSSLVMFNVAGCGGNSSNETENAIGNNQAETDTKSAEPAAKLTASTPEEFAQSIVILLAANDPNAFIEFAFPAKEELLAFGLKTISADKRDGFVEEIEKDFNEMGKQVLESFAEVRNEQASDGCDWNEAKFVAAEYDIEEDHGISTTDIDVTFSAGGQTYEFTLDDCVLVNGHWYTLDNMR